MRTFKTAMGKARAAGSTRDRALLRVLASYRALPGRDGKSPAELLHGRQPRTHLSLLQPGEEYTAQGSPPKYRVGEEGILYHFQGVTSVGGRGGAQDTWFQNV